MRPFNITLAPLIAMAAMSSASTSHAADLGSDTANRLTALYQDVRRDCGGANKPAFMCSGVMLRATTPSTAYPFYSISPNAQRNGGISISYLRRDAKYQHLAFAMTSGFILTNPSSEQEYKVLCAYPIDGATDQRKNAGCGDFTPFNTGDNGIAEDFCDRMGIRTAEQWMDRYFTATGSYRVSSGGLCAFNTSTANPDSANAFYQNIRLDGMLTARGVKFNGSVYQENELVLAPWKVDAPRSPSILASFYVNDAGVAGARLSQIQWYQATRQVLPAINLRMPATAAQDAQFVYESARQAIYPVTEADACLRYIQSAQWVNRYDAGFRKNIMSLEIVPTDCGRKTQSSHTNNFLNEMVAGYYLSPEWINNADNPLNNINSMRRQLVCVMSIARSKASWFLEPSRPDTTHDKSVAAGCNNVTS